MVRRCVRVRVRIIKNDYRPAVLCTNSPEGGSWIRAIDTRKLPPRQTEKSGIFKQRKLMDDDGD